MSSLFIILFSFAFIKFFFFAKKYDYKVTVFSGPTGSGKTMLATSLALKLIKKKMPVYSTYYIKGANKLPYDFYNYNYPENSTLIIDESQIGLDSRNFTKLMQSGVSSKLKNKLSMHRHQKLDIFFITQQPEEIDAQVRRYCSQMYYCNKTIFRRKPFFNKKFKLGFYILPYFQIYEIWPDISTFEMYKKRLNPELKPRNFGVKHSFKFIPTKVFTSYNTNQQDKASSILPMIKTKIHDDPNSLIDTAKI